MPAKLLQSNEVQLVVVDVQEKMLPHIAEKDAVLSQAVRMIRAARVFEMPVLVSEQYVKGLGPTVGDVLEVTEHAERLEKTTFSCWRDEAMRDRIGRVQRPQVVLVGIETHVCVQQTALDMLEAHLQPFVLADAVGSRRITDRDVSLARMRAAGVVVTTVESAIFEMLDRAGTERFKQMLPIVK